MIVNASIAGISSTARDRALQRVRELLAAREAELRATSRGELPAVEITSGLTQANAPQPTRGK